MNQWPELNVPNFVGTMETLHYWSQILGKVKLATEPWVNASWHIPLYVSGSGITTGLVTAKAVGFELDLDFNAGLLRLTVTDGGSATTALQPMSVASFYDIVATTLRDAGIDVEISPRPSEIAGALPFAEDHADRPFDLEAARAWWRSLVQAQRVFHRFRSRFTGKCSPIHLFWGSFDLAVVRYSGRRAPLVTRGGPNMSVAVAQDAYADEQVGCGFWPGGAGIPPSFYLEAWPESDGLDTASVGPSAARFDTKMGKWLLDYGAVRESADPDATLLEFLETGYAAVADRGGWPRDMLERDEGPVGYPPPLRS